MSVYLARDFAKTNKNLKVQLENVKVLSAKTIEQEKEKQRILEGQKEKLEQMVDERTRELADEKEKTEHALQMANAAIEIRDYLVERNKNSEIKWNIRIGLHSGKVVGGIVGVKKYIYDVFGDTINTSSRMESNSETMRINISGVTWELLKDHFEFTARQPMEIKGKGLMKMYFLESRKK